MSWELLASDGGVLKVAGEIVRLGRANDNTIVLNDPAVSRFHLNLYLKNGELIAEDAGSQNGFTVNGQPVKGAVKLNVGDKLGVGSKEYLVRPQNSSLKLEGAPNPRMAPNMGQRLGGASARSLGTAPIMAGGSSHRNYSSNEGNPRIKIYVAIIALAAGGAIFFNNEEKTTRRPASKEGPQQAVKAETLVLDGQEKFRQKGITEVQAEAKFRETLRDFYNRNYSRSILGFRDVLILNSNHDDARAHLQLAEDYLADDMRKLYEDAIRSYDNLQYGRAKAQTMRVLNLMAEQIPSYGRKIAEDAARNPEPNSSSQDESLLALPCKDYRKNSDLCLKTQKLLKEARQRLGDEDTLKEIR